MPRYRYIHSTPTVFIHLTKNGRTWTPDPGEEIETSHVVNHPYLQLIDEPKPEPDKNEKAPEPDAVDEPSDKVE